MNERIRVLIVDDDDDLRSTLSLVLAAEGFEIATAADGREALERLEQSPRTPVVLLDLRMPVMSGWDVIAELRRRGLIEEIPIVICTSAPEDAPADFPVVAKPIALGNMVEEIRRAAAGPGAGGEKT